MAAVAEPLRMTAAVEFGGVQVARIVYCPAVEDAV
jgi:hypothetical protein